MIGTLLILIPSLVLAALTLLLMLINRGWHTQGDTSLITSRSRARNFWGFLGAAERVIKLRADRVETLQFDLSPAPTLGVPAQRLPGPEKKVESQSK